MKKSSNKKKSGRKIVIITLRDHGNCTIVKEASDATHPEIIRYVPREFTLIRRVVKDNEKWTRKFKTERDLKFPKAEIVSIQYVK